MARYPMTGPSRLSAAREAEELQRAEQGAEEFLGVPAQPIPEGATEDPQPILEERADRVPAEFAGEEAVPAEGGAPGDDDERIMAALAGGEEGEGEGYPGIEKRYPAADPKDVEFMREIPTLEGEGRQVTPTPGEGEVLSEMGAEEWGPREEHLTRDRPDLPLARMSVTELQDARGRLVSAMATEPSGSQADAYQVLLNRIDRAIDEGEAEHLEVPPPEDPGEEAGVG